VVITITEPPITSFTGEYRFLSNFYDRPISWRQLVFPTAEHAYQWAKCLHQDDRYGILHAATPGEAKRIGQCVTLVPDWEQFKRRIMLNIITAKFFYDADLGNQLLATGDRELIEGNTWRDMYWGVCNGTGQNYLGRLLMITRDALRAVTE
jgi:ribA/ribD-fused uncharacterized protein